MRFCVRWQCAPALPILFLLTIAVAALHLWLLPWPLVLPVLSSVLVIGAMVVAVFAWFRPVDRGQGIDYWDVSGALVLIGCCAAMLSDPEEVFLFIESGGDQNTRQRR